MPLVARFFSVIGAFTVLAWSSALPAAETRGVTATEIKIGQTMPYSGPVSAFGALGENPNAKFAVLSQNDDFGRDYLLGLKDVLGDKYDSLVTAATYEVQDPTIDSQIVKLKASGADVLVIAATPKFAAQSIRKVY